MTDNHREQSLRMGPVCALSKQALRELLDRYDEAEMAYRRYLPCSALDSALEWAETPEEIIAVSKACLSAESIAPLLYEEIERYRMVPWYQSPAQAIDQGALTGWTVYSHAKVMATVVVIDAVGFSQTSNPVTGETVRFAAGDMALIHLAGGAVTFADYAARPVSDDNPASRETTCRYLGETVLQPDGELTIKGGERALQYAGLSGSAVILQIYCRRKRGSVIADYDRQSLQLKKIVAADQRINRLQVVSSLARLFNRADAIPALTGLTQHPDHYVRWQAAREMTALSPEAALPVLDKLSRDDANAQIRRNAAFTLQYLTKRGFDAA